MATRADKGLKMNRKGNPAEAGFKIGRREDSNLQSTVPNQLRYQAATRRYTFFDFSSIH